MSTADNQGDRQEAVRKWGSGINSGMSSMGCKGHCTPHDHFNQSREQAAAAREVKSKAGGSGGR